MCLVEEVPQDDVEVTEGTGDVKMAESGALAPRDDNTELRKQLLHMGTGRLGEGKRWGGGE